MEVELYVILPNDLLRRNEALIACDVQAQSSDQSINCSKRTDDPWPACHDSCSRRNPRARSPLWLTRVRPASVASNGDEAPHPLSHVYQPRDRTDARTCCMRTRALSRKHNQRILFRDGFVPYTFVPFKAQFVRTYQRFIG